MAVTTLLLAPHISAVKHGPADLEMVIQRIRIPTLQLGMCAGIALALSGMTFQAVFRNPLATPFTLGVSSGASLAICLAIALGAGTTFLGGFGHSGVAFIGGLAAVFVVYGVAHLRSEASTATLLLAGVCINFISGAGIILIHYFVSEHESKAVIFWLMGHVEAVADREWSLFGGTLYYDHRVAILASIVGAGTMVLIWMHRELDLLMMGHHVAASRGVDVARAQRRAYFCASLMTAGVVAVCGPIAFVGLLVPHAMRSLVGPNHRFLLPACILFGMTLLPLCDTVARNLLAWTTPDNYTTIPVGVVTNVLGGLFFLIILVRRPTDRPIAA
jgi:iron complex transport system permease protein